MEDFFSSDMASPSAEQRLIRLRKIIARIGEVKTFGEVNNHVHTTYSFSPYNPTFAALKAYMAGLNAVGIMDHDTINGADEFIKACRILHIGCTIGVEMRVNFSNTPLQGRRINHTDSDNIAYIAIHGIPHNQIQPVQEFLKPIHRAREQRNRDMVKKLNPLLQSLKLNKIDYDHTVRTLPFVPPDGCITERHILYTVARNIIQKYGQGSECVRFIKEHLHIEIRKNIQTFLMDHQNMYYEYDVLGLLKGYFLDKFYIQPGESECIPVHQAVDFFKSINAVPAYSYLGDVTQSITGDKRAQQFEDQYLDELFIICKNIGFQAVTYMPPRNTEQQLRRIRGLCEQYDMLQISGVDINNPRQSFNCPVIKKKNLTFLYDATWALIAHEHLAQVKPHYGFFHPDNHLLSKSVKERIAIYSEIGKKLLYQKEFSAEKELLHEY